MYARLLSLCLMLELAIHRSGSWKGKIDGRQGESKDKLEPTSISRQFLLSLPLVVCVSHRSWALHREAKPTPDPEKLKGDLGEGGAVVGPAGAPHQRAKPTDKQ